MLKDGKWLGVECKRVDAPRLTASMRIALDDLKLDRLVIVYPGIRAYPLTDRVEALPLAALAAGDPAVLFGSTPLLSDSLLPD